MQSHLCVSFLRSRLHNGILISLRDCNAVSRDFTFPEDARWNAERQAVEFGVKIDEYRGVVRVCGWCSKLISERPPPERCGETCYLRRTRFESIAERKLRHRQLTEDGNVEIRGGTCANNGDFG